MEAEFLPGLSETGRVHIGQLLRGQSLLACRSFNLEAVLIRPGQATDVQAAHSLVAGQGIRQNRCIGMSHVGNSVDIVKRCRQIVAATHNRFL
jgi:hypothetical protein